MSLCLILAQIEIHHLTSFSPKMLSAYVICCNFSVKQQFDYDLNENRAIRVRLATSILYDTLMKSCFKDWSQSMFAAEASKS